MTLFGSINKLWQQHSLYMSHSVIWPIWNEIQHLRAWAYTIKLTFDSLLTAQTLERKDRLSPSMRPPKISCTTSTSPAVKSHWPLNLQHMAAVQHRQWKDTNFYFFACRWTYPSTRANATSLAEWTLQLEWQKLLSAAVPSAGEEKKWPCLCSLPSIMLVQCRHAAHVPVA